MPCVAYAYVYVLVKTIILAIIFWPLYSEKDTKIAFHWRGHILSRDLSRLFLALNSLGQNGDTFYYLLEAITSFILLRVLRISFPRLATKTSTLFMRRLGTSTKHRLFLELTTNSTISKHRMFIFAICTCLVPVTLNCVPYIYLHDLLEYIYMHCECLSKMQHTVNTW